MNRKVTIFWPPGPTLNIVGKHDRTAASGPLFLAKVLERAGYEVLIVDGSLLSAKHMMDDAQLGLEKLVKIIEETSPEVLGVGSWSHNLPSVVEVTRLFKARNPDVPIVLGGINPTFLPEETLSFMPHIDYLVRGEGEYTFLELVDAIFKKEKVNQIKGLSFFKGHKIVHTPNRPLIQNLDDLPLIDLENIYKKPKWAGISVFFSRGCPHKCTFCSINTLWGAQRNFSIPHIVDQITHLKDLYGRNTITRFDPDSFLEDVKWSKKLADALHELGYNWHGLFRIDKVSKSMIDYLYKKGLRSVFIGIESMNVNGVKFLNKSQYPELYIKHAHKAIKILHEYDMDVFLSFMYGAPTETNEDFQKMNEFFKDLKSKYDDPVFGGPIIAYPGTEIWNKYQRGELELFQRFEDSKATLTEPILATKYKHIPWMAPDYYRIKSFVLSDEELENNLNMVHETLHGEC